MADTSLATVNHGAASSPEALKARIEQARASLLGSAAALERDVLRAFDWKQQVRKHPWIALGGALAVGAILGAVLRRRD